MKKGLKQHLTKTHQQNKLNKKEEHIPEETGRNKGSRITNFFQYQ